MTPGVRLLGVSVSGLVGALSTARQLSFDDDDGDGPTGSQSPRDPTLPSAVGSGGVETGVASVGTRELAWHEVEAAVSAIRARYGNASVGPAALVGREGLAVKERGDTQWGPSAPGGPGDGDP